MKTLQEGLEKNGNKIGKIVNSPLNLRIPVIKKVEVTAEQGAIDTVVAAARQYIAEIPKHMAGLVSRVNAILVAPSEERAIRARELKELEEEILAHLGAEDKLLGEAAKQAYVTAVIAGLPADKEEILTVIRRDTRLPGLLKLGVLKEIDGGDKNSMITVKVFGKPYMVNGGKAGEIASTLRRLVGDAYGKEIEKIKARADISVAELLAGKRGLAFVNAPDGKDGDRFLPGGVLLIRSDGKVVKVVEFLGHFQKIMTEIMEAGTFILAKSLNEDHLFLGEKMPENTRWHVKILHAILRRGIAEAGETRMPMLHELH